MNRRARWPPSASAAGCRCSPWTAPAAGGPATTRRSARSPRSSPRRPRPPCRRADGLRGLVRLLRDDAGLDCWVLSPLATVLAFAGGVPAPAEVERVWRRVSADPQRSPIGVAGGDGSPPRSVHAIRGARGDVRGHLVCPGPGTDTGTDTTWEAALRTALPLLGLELDRVDDRRSEEQRRVGDLLDAMGGPGADGTALAARLRALGADTGLPIVAVAVAMDAALPRAWIVGGALSGRARRVLLCERDGAVIALVNGQDQAAAIREALRGLPARYPLVMEGRTVAAGVSEAEYDPGRLPAAVDAALRGLGFARTGAGPVTVVPEADLDSHGVLLDVLPEGVRRSYRERLLGPLEVYDAEHGTELLRTLDTFLETAGSWQRSADLLYVHVNTLRYRIQRIEEMTGRSMNSMRDRTDLYLALRCPPGDPS
nr:helix-turn-helix domain-containing protein [Actinomadura sp. NBRC 104412]